MSSREIVFAAAGAGGDVNYIEDVFSTFLYSGNETARTIANGIDLSTKGGLVWCKSRNTVSTSWHNLFDTVRGDNKAIYTNQTSASVDYGSGAWSPATTGFNLGDAISAPSLPNRIGDNYCSWTFAKQAKFFDVVTYTGDGTESRSIPHNLGSVPGMIIIKSTSNTSDWPVYHRSSPGNLRLNTTAAEIGGNFNISGDSTSTNIVLGTNTTGVNVSSQTYVAYLFAHDAGGFGTAGTDNVISCGSFTTDGSGNATVSLGYEPQFFLSKESGADGDSWYLEDVMRGFNQTSSALLQANSSAAESSVSTYDTPTATGVNIRGRNTSATFIYMAIRRPMKVPTTGTEVFSPVARTGNGSTASITGINFTPDVLLCYSRASYWEASFNDRLRGFDRTLYTQLTSAESTNATSVTAMGNTSISLGAFGSVNASGQTYINWIFRRAAGFFDEVCYTGNGSTQNVAHNLTVVPELMIIKTRSGVNSWGVYYGNPANTVFLNVDLGVQSAGTDWNSTSPTSSVFSIGAGTNFAVNNNGATYVAYLFATCAGVSKVGSYTGNGGTQAIACGFTGGARFVLIKRTDSTGDWYVYDTARGMTLLTDPYLLLNSSAAESATLGSVTTTTGGFTVDASILAAINTSGASYIFLAIA